MSDPSVDPSTQLAPRLESPVVSALRLKLPAVAERTVAEIVAHVPEYAGPLTGAMRQTISQAVEMALAGFLRLTTRQEGTDPGTPLQPAIDAAYALGQGEARSGRSMDALLSAYRVGARVAWHEMAAIAVEAGVSVPAMARFAELVFAYIDELSGASVSGHADELSTTGRVRERYRERLGEHLLQAAPPEVLTAAAAEAAWPLPRTLTAVVLPSTELRPTLTRLPSDTLQPRLDRSELADRTDLALLLVPDAEGRARERLLRSLAERGAVVGPAKPWSRVRVSYLRALRAVRLGIAAADPTGPVDTDRFLADLILGADPEALEDLRARVLRPLAHLPAGTRARLAETLRCWLLHQGRREEVAAELLVHPQTVRYRMGQLRELFGDRLTDAAAIRDLLIALDGPTADPS